MTTVEDLDVFKFGLELTLDVYRVSKNFPKEEIFGLVSQMKRAVISINSNLMEGAARNSNPDFKRFISISRGSASELTYQVMISEKLGFIEQKEAQELQNKARRILKMLSGLMKTIP
ncbi:MAG: four helix bundle protein [Rickettsiales bacterium]|nr:four helix bundle protein [Rickettsiales bacterium]